MESTVHLRLLGTVQVERAGAPLGGFRSRKALALLAYLAVQGRPLPRECLADLFWPDQPEARGRANLSWVLSRIHALLPGCLEADRHSVTFHCPAYLWLDTGAFAGLEAAGDAASLAAAAELVRGEFLEGLALEGCAGFELWLVGERERWRQRAAGVLQALVTGHVLRGDCAAAMRYARRLLGLEPWREETHRQLMRLLAWDGQRSSALAQYDACRRALAGELGVKVSAETTALYEQIRAGELAPPPATVPGDRGTQPPAFLLEGHGAQVEAPVFVAREPEMARLFAFLDAALAGQGQVAFVTGGAGRGKTSLLNEFARRALDRHPDLLLGLGGCSAYSGWGDPYLPFRDVLAMLTGDLEARWLAGTITRAHTHHLWAMAPAVFRSLVHRGPQLLGLFLPSGELLDRARTVAPGGTDWLARLEALVDRVETDRGGVEQSHFFEQYASVLRDVAAGHPLLIVLDDLQWADAASASLLFHLSRRLARPGNRVLLACAYRPDQVHVVEPSSSSQVGYPEGLALSPAEGPALSPGRSPTGPGGRHPLEGVIGESRRRFGDTTVDLGSIEEPEGRRFVADLLDTQPNRLGEGFRAALFRQTGGHPLFTIELLRAMQERGDLVQDDQGRWAAGAVLDWRTLPVRVEAVVAERLGRLAGSARQLLQIASVEGETFTAEVAARILGIDERQVLHWLRRLDREHRLVSAGEIRYLDGQRLSIYRFRHVLFQRYLYDRLGEGERAYRHEDVGAALEALYGERRSEIAVPLASHFQQARNIDKAVAYLNQAGDQARSLYAHDEAIGYYQQALALLKARRDHGRAARTSMKLGLTYHSAFDFHRACQAYEEGFALWQQAGHVPQISPSTPSHTLRVDWCDPATLDPTRAWDLYSACVIDQLFSGLVEYSPGMGVTPDVARSWEVLSGGCTYVFHLRADARWSDGPQVTAGDFACALQWVLDPARNSSNAGLLYDIRGARAFHQGERAGPEELGISTPDQATLVIDLERPAPYFPYLLAHHVSFPIPQHVVASEGQAWASAGTVVGNGPFRLEAWRTGESLVLMRNPEYHGGRTGNVQRVELSLLADCAAQLQRYEAGDLDIFDLSSLPPADRDRVRHKHAGEYVSAPYLGTMYLGFDAGRPPFDDLQVRRALILATGRDYLAGVVMNGYYFPATGGLIPPGMPGHSPQIGLPHDPEQARQALAKAGYPPGRGLAPVDLLTFRSLQPYAAGLVSHWQSTLGLEVNWRAVDYGLYLEEMDRAPPRLFLTGWTADYPDPDNFLRISPIQRCTRWRNPAFAAAVEGARQASAQEERLKLYQEADRILIQEAVIMPLAYMRRHLLVKPWVKRLPMSPIKHWFWKDVLIEAP